MLFFCWLFNSNKELLDYFKDKSKSLLGNLDYQYFISKKDNCKDVHIYRGKKGKMNLIFICMCAFVSIFTIHSWHETHLLFLFLF